MGEAAARARWRSTTRSTWALGLGLLTLAVAAPAAAEPAEGTWELRTFPVVTHYGIPPGELGAPACSPDADPAPCWLTVSGTDEVMWGSFAATGHWTARVWQDESPDGNLSFDGVNFMTGTIEGCGTGTFEYHDRRGTLYTSRPDPSTMGFPAENDWVIPAESTTGELSERFVAGHGRQEWTSHPFNRDRRRRDWGTGRITGSVTCWVPSTHAKGRGPKARRGRPASQPGRSRDASSARARRAAASPSRRSMPSFA